MNVFKNVTAFWSAFVSVLLKCVAGLGFATPARTARVRSAAEVAATQAAVTPVAASSGTSSGTSAAAPTPGRTPACGALLPAPRPSSRSLPPTMKQRIRAEAHGSSPSARSIALDTTGALPYPASPALADHALADHGLADHGLADHGLTDRALTTAADDAVPAARQRRDAALVH